MAKVYRKPLAIDELLFIARYLEQVKNIPVLIP